ncbi:MAG: Asp23/Gls24 family envelope stress response protein [Lachnospiraceae bacterium]
MDGTLMRNVGEVSIDSNVIAKYAGSAAIECFGIVGMASISMKDGLAKLLYKESLTHGINVDVVNNEINISFHVIVAYGVSIQAVCENLIQNVKYKVEDFTGLKVNKINVYVEGVRIID